jgi:hypothetical protein
MLQNSIYVFAHCVVCCLQKNASISLADGRQSFMLLLFLLNRFQKSYSEICLGWEEVSGRLLPLWVLLGRKMLILRFRIFGGTCCFHLRNRNN